MADADTPGVLRVELAQAVLTLTIDRPEQRNALSPEVVAGLRDALHAAQSDDGVRVVVVTGAGDRAFCAGGDLAVGLVGDGGALAAHRRRADFGDVLRTLRALDKPVVARVNGHALAGGFGLALGCDLVVASSAATFGTTEVKVGLWPYMITAVIIEHLGPKRTLELMMTGRRLAAEDALAWGLLNQVVPPERLDEAVDALVAELLALSPAVLALGKRAWATALRMERDAAIEHLAIALSLHLQTEDAAEGIAAFRDRRPPEWHGR